MRLTRKTFLGDYALDIVFEEEQEKAKNKAINKLGKLEEIEDELGIDLITLFKALKNGVYYKYKPYGYNYKISKCRKCVLTGNRTLVVDRHTYKYLCDYGKTWALSGEELLK